MRLALVDSGLGVLPVAAELLRQSPGAELVLSIDPDGMPWGPRSSDDVAARALACARAARAYDPDVVIFACNTASVQALHLVRAELEPQIPVVGTVPAIKPAAAPGEPVAIWATAATTGSSYQRDLIRRFADGVPVSEIPCPGFADAVENGDAEAVAEAVAAAAAHTPDQTRALVLGCTHYELAAEQIGAVLPGVRLHGSAAAVAAQALRRAGAPDGRPSDDGDVASAPASLQVLLSGRPADLPAVALRYPEGRLLASATVP